MAKQSAGDQAWHTCSRGHEYQGSGGCPVCWTGNATKAPASKGP